MASIDHEKKEINAKIVYYGPEGAGKAASLRYIYDKISPRMRSELKSVPVIDSSLLSFDFTPFERPKFADYRLRLTLYTLLGGVRNPASWKMILKGADGLVIVLNAAPSALKMAKQSLGQLRKILGDYGVGLNDIPMALQLNGADQSDQGFMKTMVDGLEMRGFPVFLSSLAGGEGLLKTLMAVSRLVMTRINGLDLLSRTLTPGSDSAEMCANATPEVLCSVAPIHETVCAPSGGIDVFVEQQDIKVDHDRVHIPLVVSAPNGGKRRLVVTVMISEK